MLKHHRNGLCLFATASVLALSPSAHAQTQGEVATDDSESSGGLSDIVVTANRRAQNMQDVPIAVTAFTAEDAAKQGIVSAQTLGQIVPALQFDRVPTASTPFLRGVGTPGSTIGNEPSIAFYIDDVYVPNGVASAFEFNNIDAIEVLKGPQGTLFGRNATGGVIQIRTRNPTHETKVDATVGYGNYDTFKAQFYASTGLTDGLAVNVAGYYLDQNDGWGTNIITGRDTFRQKGWGVRAKALWEGDAMSFLLSGNVERGEGDIGMPARVRPGTFTRGGYSPDANGAGFYDGSVNTDNFGKRYFEQVSGKFRYEFDNAVLQSITAYSRTKFLQVAQDNDGSPVSFFNAGPYPQDQKAFTQELQLQSVSGSTVDWSLGAYYFRDVSEFSGRYYGQAFGALGRATATGRSPTRSYSGYAQASTEILARTNLTIGVRYTKDQRKFRGTWTLGPAPIQGPVFRDRDSWDALTGRFSIDHRISGDLMIYAAYNRGFKSGIFNIAGINPGATTAPPSVEPETLNAYSAGFKSELFDRFVRFNLEAYYYDYKNIQVFNIQPAGTLLLNGGAATIKGVDFDLVVAPAQGLRLTFGGNLQKGRYDEFANGPTFFPQPPNAPVPIPAGCSFTTYPVSANPTVQLPCNLSGNHTIQTPAFSFNAALDYELPTAIGDFGFALAYTHRSTYFAEADNSYTTLQPTSDQINGSIGWTAPGGGYDVKLWTNNLTNEKSYSYLAQTNNGGTRYAPRSPRTYGITAGVHF